MSQGNACAGDAWNDPGIGTAPVGACFDVFGDVALISLLSYLSLSFGRTSA